MKNYTVTLDSGENQEQKADNFETDATHVRFYQKSASTGSELIAIYNTAHVIFVREKEEK